MTRNDRIQIRYTITFASPFHLGTGIRAGLIDRTVIRDAEGYLYVPASTIKGVLRDHCEQLCHFYLPSEQATSPHDGYAALTGFSGTPTLISRIFGSPIYPGRLHFNDAEQTQDARFLYEGRDTENERQEKGKYKGVQTSISTQVRLDRLTRTAVSEALYTSEFGIRDLVFKGAIDGWLECTSIETLTVTGQDETIYTGTPTYSLLLLLAGLLMLERLGGNKSTGKGQCTCSITAVTIGKLRCKEEQWRSWLEHLDVLTTYSSSQARRQS